MKKTLLTSAVLLAFVAPTYAATAYKILDNANITQGDF